MKTTSAPPPQFLVHPTLIVAAVLVVFSVTASAADWTMFGRDQTRNAVSPEKNPPRFWNLEVDPQGQPVPGRGQNIKWVARLGNLSFSAPVVANGYVWIGTNNEQPRDPAVKEDAAVLMCFRESDGEFIWQYLAPRRKGVRYDWHDWQYSGIKTTPLINADRLWFATPGAHVVCLDIGPLLRRHGKPRERWKFDLAEELGVFPHPSPMGWPGASSLGLYKNWVYANTGNGVGWDHSTVVNPAAPSLVCFEKETGKVVWSDELPDKDIFHQQWSSPLVVELNGKGRVIFGSGDGKLGSFDAENGAVLWTLDCNPAEYRAEKHPAAEGPSEILAAPVFHGGRVYVSIGQDPEHGEGVGNVICVDASTGRADCENRAIHRSLSSVVVVGGRRFPVRFRRFSCWKG